MRWVAICSVLVAILSSCGSNQKPLVDEAEEALEKAARFFRTKVAVHGSYVWRYSADLKKRWGEGEASETEGWVQPPGTSSWLKCLSHNLHGLSNTISRWNLRGQEGLNRQLFLPGNLQAQLGHWWNFTWSQAKRNTCNQFPRRLNGSNALCYRTVVGLGFTS